MEITASTLVSDSILSQLAFPLPPALSRRILSLSHLDDVWARGVAIGGPVFERLLTALRVEWDCEDGDLRLIPRTGPAIVTANHPFGILDGMLAASLLGTVRADVKIVANSMLSFRPELADHLIPVDIFGKGAAKGENRTALRQALRWLECGGMLLVFPGGAVSRFRFRRGGVTDPAWSPHFVDLATRIPAKMVPLFISGSNSALFHTVSLLNDALGSALLPRELMKQQRSRIAVRVGQPIAAETLSRFATRGEATEYVRFRTYLLDNRRRQPGSAAAASAIDTVDPIHTGLLIRDIDRLPAGARLYSTGEYSVYIAHACEIPNVLPEIGRLRELSFRAEGEGTGRSVDLDIFDEHYQHLFAWHNQRQEIVGSYRLGLSEDILPKRGPDGLYTTTLFRFPESWWRMVAPAIELGRSFIRLEHQRHYGALLALWRGIGAFLKTHSQYRYLFGPVSISGRYKAASKQLIASYLKPGAGCDVSQIVTAHTPPHADFNVKRAVEQQPLHVLRLDDIDAMIKDIEPDRCGLPVLLRHYVNLGGRILAFNEDAHFSSAVDGLLLIDLLNADKRRLDRFLGRGVVDKIASRVAEAVEVC